MNATVGRDATTMTDESVRRIEASLWPGQSRGRDIWAIVDCARDTRIYPLLLESFYSQHHCLFSGPLTPELTIVAPYLVQLEPDDRHTRKLIAQAWGNSWGIFLACDSRLESLRRHLRSLLVVRDRRNREMMFRFYDPRVLRLYLPTCTSGELQTVFGPIRRMWIEGETPDTMLELEVSSSRLVTRSKPV
jgi:hypothetical protein